MLALNQEMELNNVKNYMAHADLANELGYVELELKLEGVAADEAGHAREVRRILKGL